MLTLRASSIPKRKQMNVYMYTLEPRAIQLCSCEHARRVGYRFWCFHHLKSKYETLELIPLAVLPLSDVIFQPLPLHVKTELDIN